MRKLTGGTVVTHPGSGVPTFLAKDGDLPEWAEGLVGDHLLTAAPTGYGAMKKADLLAEVERRNAARDDAEQIVPESDKNADLVAALEADDAVDA